MTMMEAIKKVRERDDALDLVFRKARSYNAWLPTPVLETFITSASPTNRPWIGALSCGSLLMHVLWILAVLIAETRRRIAGDRLAMAKPGSIE